MKKINLWLGIIVAGAMVLAAACGGAAPAPAATVTVTKTASPVTVTAPPVTVTTTPTPAPAKLTKLKYAEVPGGGAMLTTRVGKDKGFFGKRGLDPDVIEVTVTAARMAVFTGVGEVGAADILPFYTERKDARMIGPQFNAHHAVMVRKDSPYKSYQDLKGKKMGILGPATGQYQMAKVVAKLEGLDLEKDFQLIVGDPLPQVGWLLKGEVEAIHLYEPYPSRVLVSDGDKIRELYWLNDAYKKYSGSDYPQAGIYTTEDFVKKNPDLARQMGLAYNDIMTYMYANDQVWGGDLAKKNFGIDDPKVLQLLTQRMSRIVAHPPYGPAYKDAFIKRAQFMADVGLIPREAVDWVKGSILFADAW